MGISFFRGEDSYYYPIEAALEGRTVDYRTPDGVIRMQRAQNIVSLLSEAQREDFLNLYDQGFATPPAGITTNRFGDIGEYLLSLSPEQFLRYYILISKEREAKKGVREILESQI